MLTGSCNTWSATSLAVATTSLTRPGDWQYDFRYIRSWPRRDGRYACFARVPDTIASVESPQRTLQRIPSASSDLRREEPLHGRDCWKRVSECGCSQVATR